MYGSSREFMQAPRSTDGAARLLWKYAPTGRLSLLYLGARDRIAVSAHQLNYEGTFTSRTSSQLGALQWQQALGRAVALRGHLALQHYDSDWTFGASAMDQQEVRLTGQLDATWAASPRHEIATGLRFARRADDLLGTFPADSTDLAPGAPVRFHDTRPRLQNPGAYLEDKIRLWGPLYATLGARFDRVSLADTWTADPRAALAWRVDAHQTVRVATGRYHQPAEPGYLDPVYGNPSLGPLEADHWIAGYEWLGEETNVRVEAYRKRYDDLVTQSSDTYYANEGHGYARGIDMFARTRTGPWTGWVSYGFLDTRRREGDALTETPTPYGVRHSLTLVGAVQLPGMWQLGGRFGLSSGQPYTPVTGATYDSTRGIWHPVEGPHYSATMPVYHRFDFRVTRLFSLPAGLGLPASGVSVLYAEALNVFAVPNVLEYVYNEDYSAREEVLSYFSRRMIVAGFALTW